MPHLNTPRRKQKAWSKKKTAPNALGITGVSGGLASKIVVLGQDERFFWYPYFPANELIAFAGIQGCNKSTTLRKIVAKASVGLDIFDKPLPGGVASSVIYSCEDSAELASQQIEAFGGDMTKIVIIDGYFIGEDKVSPNYAFREQIQADIKEATRQTGMAPAIIAVDTLARYLTPKSTAIKQHVEECMEYFRSRVARRHNAIVLFIHHSQGKVKSQNDAFAGSMAIKQFMRATYYVTKYEERDGLGARYMAPIKTSWVKDPDSIAFRIGEAVRHDDKTNDITWTLEPTKRNLTTDEIIANAFKSEVSSDKETED